MKTTKNHTRRCHDGGSRLDDDNHIGAWTKADLSDATDGSGDKILTRDPEGYSLGGDASTNRASRPWPTRGYQHGGYQHRDPSPLDSRAAEPFSP